MKRLRAHDADQPVLELVINDQQPQVRVAEFFAGTGLARLGLERAGANVVWANDLDADKCAMYRNQFGSDEGMFVEGDISDISGHSMPERIDVAWGSFPCIDLSLAGWRRGLSGQHSSTFWEFSRILDEMGASKPQVVALENVTGFATSHGGKDLAEAIRELNRLGYSADVLTLDARRFVPQSRPRLFVVGSLTPPESASELDHELRPKWLLTPFADTSLVTHVAPLPSPPAPLTSGLRDVVQRQGDWWSQDRVEAFVGSLSPMQNDRLEMLKRDNKVTYRTAYRRTRKGVSRWEIRTDDIAGCLRTARGGSSKQALVRAGRGSVKVRWMTPREYARLMGAGDYNLNDVRTNQALFGFGDAVCVPAVQWLAEHYLIPLAAGNMNTPPAPLREAVCV